MSSSLSRRPLRSAGLLLLGLSGILASGCATNSARAPVAESAPAKRTEVVSSGGVANARVSAAKASRDIQLPEVVVVRRYDDVFRENGADVPVTVEYGWDYRKGVCVERVFTRDGKPRSSRELPGQTVNFTDIEVELAFALTREHAQLSKTLSEPNLNFYAGFAYLDATDAVCKNGSRCVHVIVSGGFDGQRPVAHAIVDLMSRQVVHPFFGPDNPGLVNKP